MQASGYSVNTSRTRRRFKIVLKLNRERSLYTWNSFPSERIGLHPSQLVHRPTAYTIALAVRRERLLSSKHLDFWSLALCSCILTLLCHSFAAIPSNSTTTSSPLAQESTPSTQANSNITFKLFTLISPRPKVEKGGDKE